MTSLCGCLTKPIERSVSHQGNYPLQPPLESYPIPGSKEKKEVTFDVMNSRDLIIAEVQVPRQSNGLPSGMLPPTLISWN